MSRITKKELQGKLRRCARGLGIKTQEQVTYNPKARKYKWSHPHLELELAYGQVALFIKNRQGTGTRIYGFISTREMYFLLTGLDKSVDIKRWIKKN